MSQVANQNGIFSYDFPGEEEMEDCKGVLGNERDTGSFGGIEMNFDLMDIDILLYQIYERVQCELRFEKCEMTHADLYLYFTD